MAQTQALRQVVLAPNLSPEAANPDIAGYLARIAPAYAGRTRQALASDWRCFARWCRRHRRRGFPASAASVAAYLQDSARGHSLATLRRRLATLSHLHDALGAPNPTRDQAVRLALRAIARVKGNRPLHRRAPLLQADVRRILAALGNGLRDSRDRALLLAARDSLARRSELAALAAEDIDWRDAGGGARALIRRAKNDAGGAGRSVWLCPETCAALKDWLARAGITEGAVFRRVYGEGHVGAGLHPQSIALRLKAMAAAAGLDASRVSGHSTRIGMTVDLAQDGQSLLAIQLAGGWRSPVMPGHYASDLLPELGAVGRYHRARAAGMLETGAMAAGL